MVHKLVSMYMRYDYVCGKCGHEWSEDGECHLSYTWPNDMFDQPIECPECEEELEVEIEE